MSWQDIIKYGGPLKPEIKDGIEKLKSVINDYTKKSSEFNWSVEFPSHYTQFNRFKVSQLFFRAKSSTGTSLTVKGKVPVLELDIYVKAAINVSQKGEIDYENSGVIIDIIEKLKPSFRSLDWVLETTKSIEDIELPYVNAADYAEGIITVKSISGSQYTIDCTALKDSGCYKVETEEGWYICIEMEETKPVGDNLLGLILGLYNDENTRQELEGLDQYLDGELEVSCEVCGYYQNVRLETEAYTCENCSARSDFGEISFEPAATFALEVHGAYGPIEFIQGYDLTNHHLRGDEFYQGNKVFRLDDPENFTLTVANEPDEEIFSTSEGDIFHDREGRLFDFEGYLLGIAEVYDQIDPTEVAAFFDEYTNYGIEEVYQDIGYDNIGGSLWTDGEGLYGDSGKIDSIEDIYNASEMSEEEFLEEAPALDFVLTPEEILDYFGYTNEGDYWSKDGKYYTIDGSYIEESEITKNLSSKAVLPINMKWTDYLKKTSGEDSADWESALKSFISDGKKLGIPLSVMELLKLAKEATTSQSEGFETLHRPTFSEEEEEDV